MFVRVCVRERERYALILALEEFTVVCFKQTATKAESLTLYQMLALFVNLVFLGSAFTIMLVYVWSRRNPYVRMNFFGLMNFQAPYLPWVLLGFSLLLGNSIIIDLMGEWVEGDVCKGWLVCFPSKREHPPIMECGFQSWSWFRF